jgi:hypothetical protein
MYVKQAFSLLFFLRHGKRSKKSGKTPMYFRLKIDGASVDRCVKGVSLLPNRWDNENGIVKTDERQHKAFNKKITQLKTDLERHFDLIQAKGEIAIPTLVLKAYQTPVRADKRKEEKVRNLALSQTVDELIGRYLKFNDKWVKAYKHNRVPYAAEEALLARVYTR